MQDEELKQLLRYGILFSIGTSLSKPKNGGKKTKTEHLNVFVFSVLRSAPELHTLRLPAAQTVSADTVCQLMQLPSLRSLEVHNKRNIWKNSDNCKIASAVTQAASDALERLTLRDPPKALSEAWSSVKGLNSATKTCALGLHVFETLKC